MKKTIGQFIKISLIILLMLTSICFGCGLRSNQTSVLENAEYIKDEDFLSVQWIAPSDGYVETDDWDVVQYVPGLATPTDESCYLRMNNISFGANSAYSLLFLEESDTDDSVIGYEFKCVSFDDMEVKTVWQSVSEMNFDNIWEDDYVYKIERLFQNGCASVFSVDTWGEEINVFVLITNDEGILEHIYRIETLPDARVKNVVDYVDCFDGIADNSTFILPEIICGTEDIIYCIDYVNKEIKVIGKDGNETCTVNAVGLLNNLKCIGRNTGGIPIFSCTLSSGNVEFFYIDDKGEHVLFNGKTESGIYTLGQQGNVLILSGSKLISWNVAKGEKTLLYDFKGLSSFQCMGITESENNEIIACFENGEDAFIYRLNNVDHTERKELVFLQDFHDPYTEKCAADYSRTHPGINIKVEQIEANDEFCWNRIINDIKDGTGPDIIWTDREHLDKLHAVGALCPLDGMISTESVDNIFKGALRIGEFNSGLYAIPGEAWLNVLMVDNDNWDDNKWTLKEAMNEYEKWNDKTGSKRFYCFPYGLSSLKLFMYLCLRNIEYSGFADIESRTCSFQTNDFYNLLRFCKDNDDSGSEYGDYLSGEEAVEAMIGGEAFALYSEGGLINYSELRNKLGERYHAVGEPADTGIRSTVSVYRAAAISAFSNNKEIAADFVSSLISEEYQAKYTTAWVRKDIIKEHVKDAVEIHKHTAQGVVSEIIPIFMINTRGYIPLPGRGDGSSYADEYIELMDAGVPVSVEYEVQNIILEEVQAYFSGDKTEEVARIIQSRVQLYLNE